jgi:hypothetical protein
MRVDGFLTEFGGLKNEFFKRKIYIKRDDNFYDKVDSFIESYHNTDVYICMYNYETEDTNNCNILGSPYLDFDADITDEESYQKLTFQVKRVIRILINAWKISPETLQLYFSGHKGFHVVIPYEVLGLTPRKNLNDQFKRMAMYFKVQFSATAIDTGIYDRKRLFRIPNSINGKSGLYKVPITIEQLQTFTFEQMQEWAAEPRSLDVFEDPKFSKQAAERFNVRICSKVEKRKIKKEPLRIPTEHQKLLPCVANLLRTSIGKGARNRTTVALASSIMQSGYKLSETEELLTEWNDRNDPPLSEREMGITITSAYSQLRAGKGYGCSSFRDLDACIGSKCKLRKGETKHGRR